MNLRVLLAGQCKGFGRPDGGSPLSTPRRSATYLGGGPSTSSFRSRRISFFHPLSPSEGVPSPHCLLSHAPPPFPPIHPLGDPLPTSPPPLPLPHPPPPDPGGLQNSPRTVVVRYQHTADPPPTSVEALLHPHVPVTPPLRLRWLSESTWSVHWLREGPTQLTLATCWGLPERGASRSL